jgi:hypothetical protein
MNTLVNRFTRVLRGPMSIESDILEAVQDMLATDYGLRTRYRNSPDERCSICGVKNEPRQDYLGNPNGYTTHQVGECIENLRERIDRLESALLAEGTAWPE